MKREKLNKIAEELKKIEGLLMTRFGGASYDWLEKRVTSKNPSVRAKIALDQ